MKHLIVGVCQVCSNKSHGVKIGPVPEVIYFPYMYRLKNLKSFFLKKTQRARAEILRMKHLLVSVYQVCSNKSPEDQNWPRPRTVIVFLYIFLYD
jgi:hypothetical protein